MKLPDSFNKLVEGLLTVQDKRTLAERLESLSSGSFRTDFDIEKEASKILSQSQLDALKACLQEMSVDLKNAQAVQAALAGIIRAVRKIPQLTFSVAVTLPADFIQELAKKYFSEPIVFDIHVDPHVITGAVIEYNGRYLDRSFAAKWKELKIDYGLKIKD